jgi:hypothetical protein
MRHEAIKLFAAILVILPLAACNSGATKAGGKTGSEAASAKQKSGSQAKGNRESGAAQGPDYEGVTCDSGLEGVGWCSSDAEIVFCSQGEWWLLDCGAIDEGAFCGFDEAAEEVDCYVEE